jgi:hypothetical protein
MRVLVEKILGGAAAVERRLHGEEAGKFDRL